MSIGRLQNEADLERFVRDHLRRVDVRRSLAPTVPPVQAPTFATGWSDFGAPYNNAGYYRDRNRVYLRGAVKSDGSGTGLIFTLPADCCPAATVTLSVPVFGPTPGYLNVTSSGAVTDLAFSASSKTFTALDGISFRVADG